MPNIARDVLTLVWLLSGVCVIAAAAFAPSTWQHRDTLLGGAVLVNTTSLTFFFARMWWRSTPLRRYGSVIDPAARPLAYNLCMSFLVFMFAAVSLGIARWLVGRA